MLTIEGIGIGVALSFLAVFGLLQGARSADQFGKHIRERSCVKGETGRAQDSHKAA